MSKSSKRLLIAGGCSFTSDKYAGYSENNITTWPHIVGEELDADVLNTAMPGGSNDRITNVVMDAIIDNIDRELIVMVLWSSPNRLNFFDADSYVYPVQKRDLNFHNREFTQKMDSVSKSYNLYGFRFDKYVLNYNLRAMWKLNKLTETQNINFYQINTHSLISNIVCMGPHLSDDTMTESELSFQKEREKRLIDYAPTNRYFNKDYFTTQHWRNNIHFIENAALHISKDDQHPNQTGHYWIADNFLLQIDNKLIRAPQYDAKIVHDSDFTTDFVYD